MNMPLVLFSLWVCILSPYWSVDPTHATFSTKHTSADRIIPKWKPGTYLSPDKKYFGEIYYR